MGKIRGGFLFRAAETRVNYSDLIRKVQFLLTIDVRVNIPLKTAVAVIID